MLESLFSKVYSKETPTQVCFPVNIAEFLRIAVIIEHLWWLLKC